MSDTQTINMLKGLVIDGVGKANSGHPGGAMSSMDFAYILFTEYLKHDPKDTKWLGRDRFILSAGHESMLLYSLLYMMGHLPMEELKNFRQFGSKTPGHPENTITDGVECTTGPLGQGAAMSVGFAMGARHFHAALSDKLFNQKVYSLLGDGCMQEGITLGAASLAGHLGLENLVWYYDRNRIQISGDIDRSFSDDTAAVFKGFGWDVVEIDGHDHDAIRKALDGAKEQTKPLLIVGDTIIGKGTATLEGSAKTHGAPLKEDEHKKTKEKLGLPLEEFYVQEELKNHFQRHFAARQKEADAWRETLKAQLKEDEGFAKAYRHAFEKEDFSALKPVSWDRDKPIASRVAFGQVLAHWAKDLPNLMGGSADLEPSNMTGEFAKIVGDFTKQTPQNRNIAFGVREFPMSAICNGLALFGGIIPFDATFLTFADYSRPAIRLGAIQQTRVIHELTHDSFYLGEDGPTHQPVEHVMSLRLIPEVYVMRPADSLETELLMRKSLELKANTALCLTRQGMPYLANEKAVREGTARGGYVIKDEKEPDVVIFATGSEVSLALEAAELLADIKVKVVSLPCWELFDEQEASYKESILTKDCQKRVSIEAGSTLGWQRFTGFDGLNIGRDAYGDSAPNKVLAKKYGFTGQDVALKITKKWF